MSTTNLPGPTLGRLALTSAAVGALALALTGCGGADDSRPELTSGGSSSSSSTSESPSESESESSSPSESSSASDPETAGVFDIAVGDCLAPTDLDGEVSDVPTIPCDQPHDSEVYLSIMMDDAPTYPGEEAVTAAAEACSGDGFTQFIGVAYDSSDFFTNTLSPTEESWASGDREILCLVYEPEVLTTGTLRGAGR